MENSIVAECAWIDGIDLKSDENENNSPCMEKVQNVFEEMGVPVATDEKGRKIIGEDHQQMIVKVNNWGSQMMRYNNRKKLKNEWLKIDLTKKWLTLLNQARAKTSGKPSIDFIFADVNCCLQLKTKSGYFHSFKTMRDLDDILTEIEEEDGSVSE